MYQQSGEINEAMLRGTVHKAPRLTHEYRGQAYYLLYVAVPRLSGVLDILPVTAPGYLLEELPPLHSGDWVEVRGKLRSYNRQEGDKRRLVITLYARMLAPCEAAEGSANEIELGGYLCREPLHRTTPLHRQIADLMLAVNRPVRGSDYLPVIAWGESARLSRNYPVGSFVHLRGRFQSREYSKLQPDGASSVRVAYEVSAAKLKMGEK